MKYGEEKIVEEIRTYLESTYQQHYSTVNLNESISDSGFQVQDILRHLDINKDFCQANAIKYLCRYGRKNGYNRADLLKAVHYIILLMSEETNDESK